MGACQQSYNDLEKGQGQNDISAGEQRLILTMQGGVVRLRSMRASSCDDTVVPWVATGFLFIGECDVSALVGDGLGGGCEGGDGERVHCRVSEEFTK